MPHKTKIANLTQQAAEVSRAWQEHGAKGETEAAEQNRVAALDLNRQIAELTKKQAEHDEMTTVANHYLETASRPPRFPSPSAQLDGSVLNRIDREIVLDALNRGVDKAASSYGLPDHERDALGHVANVHNRAYRAYVGAKSERAGSAMARKIMGDMPDHVQNAMWTVEDDKGGFLVAPTYRSQPIENRIKPGTIRSLARVEPTTGDLIIPVIRQPTSNANYSITDFTGEWVAEGNRQANEQVLNVDQLRIATHEWQGYWVPITEKLYKNATANVVDIVSRVIVAAANLAEGIAFWTGDGIGRPEGLLRVGNTVTEVNSGHASQLTPAGLRTLHFTLRTPYRDNGTYAMNSLTYGNHVLGLESTGGTYVFPQNQGQMPFTLHGRPVVFDELLDSVSAGNHPIVFGDFAEGYTIAEQSVLRIIRSDEKFIPQIAFLPTMTIGGQTTQLAAFVQQKVAA